MDKWPQVEPVLAGDDSPAGPKLITYRWLNPNSWRRDRDGQLIPGVDLRVLFDPRRDFPEFFEMELRRAQFEVASHMQVLYQGALP